MQGILFFMKVNIEVTTKTTETKEINLPLFLKQSERECYAIRQLDQKIIITEVYLSKTFIQIVERVEKDFDSLDNHIKKLLIDQIPEMIIPEEEFKEFLVKAMDDVLHKLMTPEEKEAHS
jgi:hypothetical protein